jgi:hypothetical protein
LVALFIKAEKSRYLIKLLCRVKVNRSAYYAYSRGRTYRESPLKRDCAAAVKACFIEHRRRYGGTRRIAAELKIGRAAVRRIMRRENLTAIAPKSFKPQMTDSKHGLPVCANLLQDGERAPTGKGEVMVGDITYLRLRGGTFCYLACLQDKFMWEYALDELMEKDFDFYIEEYLRACLEIRKRSVEVVKLFL